jgi:predicted membrane-bound dolichyl-phosphate-mannose-protein mannosyltransferase
MLDAQWGLRPRQADPQPGWTWLVQRRTTVLDRDASGSVTVRATSSPLVWGSATLVLVGWLIAWGLRRRRGGDRAPNDRRMVERLVIAGLVAAWWLPWLVGSRLAYSFYAAPIVPLLAIAVTVGMSDLWFTRWSADEGPVTHEP